MNDVLAAQFESLDYIYVPAPDFEAAVRFYTVTIGGALRWRIHDGGVWVAAVTLANAPPAVLLAGHLEPHETILIYRVRSLAEVRQRLNDAGWSDVDDPLQSHRDRAWCSAIRPASGSLSTSACGRGSMNGSTAGSTHD